MRWMLRAFLGALCVLSVAVHSVVAQPLPHDPDLAIGTLDNGLRYVIRKHSQPPQRVAMWLHVDSGSLNETDDQRGLAHYLEHMAFNGSENFPPGAVVPYFESLGMTFGRDQNAMTSFDQTTYQLALPDTQPETIAKGLTFFADILLRLLFVPKEIEDERQIIQEERRRSLSGQQRTMYHVLERLAPGSTLGQRIPIGTQQTIDSLQREDFLDYYTRWYVASNATLLVVADVQPDLMVTMIRDAFRDAPVQPRPRPRDVGVTAYDESFAIVASDPEVRTEQVRITRLEPARPATTTVELFRDELVAVLGTLAFNRRLSDKVAAGDTSYLAVSASVGNQVGVIYTAEVGGRAKPGQWQAALAEMALELQRARAYGFADQELEDAKREMMASARRAVETEPTSDASVLLRRMNQAIAAGEPIISAQQRLELIEQLLPTVTRDEVSQCFTREFDPTHFSVTAILPADADVPTETALLQLAEQALAVKPEREAVAERATSLMEELPQPGSLTQLDEHSATGVWSGLLSNNVRFHYRFMDTRANEVKIRIALLGGALLETSENRGITRAATVAWSRPATKRLSSPDIRALMTGKNVEVRLGGGDAGPGMSSSIDGSVSDSITLEVEGSPQDLEDGLQLAHLLLTEPKVEPAALDQLITTLRLVLEQMQSSPLAMGGQLVQEVVYPRDVARTQPLTVEQLERWDAPEPVQAWLDRLLATSPIEVVVVGDLPRERALELIARYLGSLPSRAPVEADSLADSRRLERPQGAGTRRLQKAIATETPQAYVFSGFYGADETNVDDMRALTVATMILTTRMIQEIREQEQLVYGIAAGSRAATTYPGFGVVSASAPTDPAKVERLLNKIAAMYAALAEAGVTDEELAVAKRQVAVTLDQQLRDPDYWLSRLSKMVFLNRSLDDLAAAPAAYQAMTAERLRETFARYYVPDSTMEVVVTPADQEEAE